MTLSVATAGAQAAIEWLDTICDVGVFDEGAPPLAGSVRFANVGDSPVIITHVQPTCGCTAAGYPSTATQPGDTAEIRLVYTPIGRPGPFSKDIFVYTDCEGQKKTVIAVTGRMRGTPESIDRYYPARAGGQRLSRVTLPAGEQTRGRMRNVTTVVYNTRPDTVVLTAADTIGTSLAAGNNYLSVHLVNPIVEPAGACSIAIFVDTRFAPQWGFNEDTVTLYARPLNTALPADTIRLVVTAIVNEDFSTLNAEQMADAPVAALSTKHIDIGDIATGTRPAPVVFRVKNSGRTDDLIVRRVYTPGGGKADCSRRLLHPGEEALITVTPPAPQADEPTFVYHVDLITNDPLHPVQQVKITGLLK